MSTPILGVHAALLLLAHDPTTGRALVDDTHLKPALAGAALLELTRTGVLRAEGEGKRARFVATGGPVPPELAESMDRAAGRTPRDAVSRIGGTGSFTDRAGRLRQATWLDLELAGAVRPEHQKILGLIPRTRWVQLRGERARLVTELGAALAGASPADPTVPALASVAQACGLLRKVFPEIPAKELQRRSAALAGDLWGGPAVAKAIADINAAVLAATVAATGAAVAGGASG